MTIFGHSIVPAKVEEQSYCLAGIKSRPNIEGEELFVVDSCAGLLIKLRKTH